MKKVVCLFSLVMVAGCADAIHPDTETSREPWDFVESQDGTEEGIQEQAEELERPTVASEEAVPTLPPEVLFPDPGSQDDCELPWTDDLPRNLEIESPGEVLHENIGEHGCVIERWSHEHDGLGRVVQTDYTIHDWDRIPASYIVPVEHSRTLEYEADQEQPARIVTHVYGEQGVPGEQDRVFIEELRYDEEGRTIEHRGSSGGFFFPQRDDGPVPLRTWSYDDQGRLLQHEHRAGEELQSGERHEYVGSQEQPVRSWKILGGEWVRTQESELDEQGRIVHKNLYDTRGLSVQAEHFLTYSAEGVVSELRVLRHDQGWLDLHRYDEQGREVHYHQDENRDGLPEYVRDTIYGIGDTILHQETSYDFDAARRAHRVGTMELFLDERGRVARVEKRTLRFEAGRMAVWMGSNTIHDYREDGSYQVRLERISNDVTRLHSVAQHTAEGLLLERETDADHDGDFERLFTQRHDARGEVVEQRHVNRDLETESLRWRLFDAHGRLTGEWVDDDGDGTLDSRMEYRFGRP